MRRGSGWASSTPQGPNLSYLGRRQPEIYGRTSAAELDAMLLAHARAKKYHLDIFYTHTEGVAIERLYRAVDEKSTAW